MELDDRLSRIEEDIRDVRVWQRNHDERHGDEADMLTLVLGQLKEHSSNHHGAVSTAKQAGYAGGLVALLGVVAELIRQFLL